MLEALLPVSSKAQSMRDGWFAQNFPVGQLALKSKILDSMSCTQFLKWKGHQLLVYQLYHEGSFLLNGVSQRINNITFALKAYN